MNRETVWAAASARGWMLRPVKYVATKIGSGKTPSGGSSAYVAAGVMFLRSQNVYDEGLRLDDVVFIDAATDHDMRGTRVRAGDVLLNITGASIGRCAVAPPSLVPANVNQHVCIIRPSRQIHPEYLAYALKSHITKAQIYSGENGSSREGLNFEQVGNLLVALPREPAEQVAIAGYLDRKTAAIDATIAKHEHLAALLAEKQEALITHAVTKGLDPNAGMKDSGVEWLGAIPAGWQVSRSKWLFQQRKQRAHVEDEQLTASQAYGVIPQREYTARTGQRVVQLTTNFELRKRVERDDFVISMRSFEGGLERAWAAGGIRSSYVVLKPTNAVDVGYYGYLFKCSAYISALQGTALFIRDGQDLTFENFVLVDLPLPPKEEQQRIANSLDAQVAAMNELADKARALVGRLREYRQALITAAVTGQVDIAVQPQEAA